MSYSLYQSPPYTEKFLKKIDQVSVGFDQLFDRLLDFSTNSLNNFQNKDNYPPYNIKEYEKNHYVVELALAGFKKNDLSVSLKEGIITVSGNVKEQHETTENGFLHRGIGMRKFTRNFFIADNIEVKNVCFSDGILSIYMYNVVPPEKESINIPIEDTNVNFKDNRMILSEETSKSFKGSAQKIHVNR